MFRAFLVDCWTAEENTNVPGGVVNSANTVQDCQTACINNASCIGVDWNDGAQSGQKCWLSGPWSGDKRVGQAPGITHYNLDRNCAGKNCWTAEENTNVPGGVVNSANTVQACQSACVNNASCIGVDWNDGAQTGQKCWLSGPWSGDKRVGQAPGITHYNLDRNCAGNIYIY